MSSEILVRMTEHGMDPNEEATYRKISHLLLDLVSAYDVDDPTALPPGWAQTVASDLTNAGAIHFVVDEGADPPTRRLNMTPLVGAVSGLLHMLIASIADSRGADRLAVIASVREAVDQA